MDTKERKRHIYRVTVIGLAVNIVLTVLKFAAGVAGRSGAMVADAVHSLSDMATDIVVIAFVGIASKPSDSGHDYGHGKYETLATLVISLALLTVGVGILSSSISAILVVVNGGELPRPGGIAVAAAAVSIVAKEVLYRYTLGEARRTDSSSMRANAWHHRSDALSSLGTFTGIGLAYFFDAAWRIADPVAAIIVSLFIFKIAFTLIIDGVGELMERSLPEDTEGEIIRIATADKAVQAPHNLRTRRIGSVIAIEMHVRVDPEMSVSRSHALTTDIERRLRERFGAETLISIHVEPIKQDSVL